MSLLSYMGNSKENSHVCANDPVFAYCGNDYIFTVLFLARCPVPSPGIRNGPSFLGFAGLSTMCVSTWGPMALFLRKMKIRYHEVASHADMVKHTVVQPFGHGQTRYLLAVMALLRRPGRFLNVIPDVLLSHRATE